jgi:UDP-3-O-[3-hydroxymyristoyl] glucosamine N-acyltransferase
MPAYSVRDLAERVGGQALGNVEQIISSVSDLASAQAGQISFLGNQRYLKAARSTKASAVVVGVDIAESFSSAEIRVVNPSLAFAQIVALYTSEPIRSEPGIHPTALLGQGVELGENVSIQPYVVIESGVKIGARSVIGAGSYLGHETVLGEDCLLYPRVTVRERTLLGCRVILHSGVVLGSDGFGYEFQDGRHLKIPQTGYVQIDDDVEIGANTTVDRGRFGRTWIQRGSKLDNLVMIAHNVVIGEHSIIVSQSGISGSTVVGRYFTLAGQSGLAGHLNVGEQVTITAQSGVAKDVPSKAVLSGRHALPLREALKLEALGRRLPELLARIETLEKQLAQPADFIGTSQES